MSTNTKIVTWVVVAVVVVGGGIWWWMSMSPTAVSPTYNNPPAPTAQTPTSTQNPTTDNSNAAVQANLASIDSQMSGFSSDNTSINQGMSDQPVTQSQL